jgi:hypothetical protein
VYLTHKPRSGGEESEGECDDHLATQTHAHNSLVTGLVKVVAECSRRRLSSRGGVWGGRAASKSVQNSLVQASVRASPGTLAYSHA